MTYKFGKHSVGELEGVHPSLIKVAWGAIAITEVDFTIHDGIRELAQQEEYVRTGVSQTLKSMHLRQQDGFGHALDLVPYIGGKLRWEMPPILLIASAVRQAARDADVAIKWGGCWERLDDDVRDPGLMAEEYIAKRRRQGRRPFVDGPHFELL